MTTSRRHFIELFATLGATAAAVPLSAFARSRAPALGHKESRTRLLLGCAVRITVAGGSPKAAGRACDAALDTIEQIEQELSIFLPGSALSRLNRDGVLEDAPASMLRSLTLALEIARASRGAFDPTVQPVLALIASSFRERNAPPTEDALAQALRNVGHARVRIAGTQVRLEPGMAITLNGIAKGYAMDEARRVLLEHGAGQVIATASGDMAIEGTGFKVALQDPLHPTRTLARAAWRPPSGGVGSSGGYMNHFTQDLRWHHLCDPRTGHSPTHFAGVVVHARTAMEADVLSTTSFVLPESEALALVASRGAALWAMRADGSEVRSPSSLEVGL